VGGSSNLSQSFNGTLFVNISNGSVSIMELYWNFTNSTLYMNFTIDVQPPNSTYGAVLVKGLVLEQNRTKNVSMLAVNNTISTVCVKDADVAGISNISSSCNSLNETLISCPGSNGSYSCSLVNNTLNNTYYKMSGLRFSAAKQQCPDSDADGYYANGCGNGTDCDDIRANVYSGAPEVCNDNLDNNCNGQTDENCGSSGGSSGGGGGGGGGSPRTEKSAKATYVFTQVTPGKENSMRISNPAISLIRISFSTNTAYRSLSIVVEPLNATEAEQNDLNHVYQYVKVQPSTAISDQDISYALIDFKVNKSWINANGYDKALVTMKRLKGGMWDALPTSPVNETELAYTYSAETPGFSVFAITAEKVNPEDNIARNTTYDSGNATTPSIGDNTTSYTPYEAKEPDARDARMPEKGSAATDTGTILLATLIGILLASAAIAYIILQRKRKL
ncbi:PGF-pre-PGF domain-containing protein, partial [Candidatus Woesearchaeota archaeon]|nr:PGF-pre-PGF domain-containing protein [Candidatus Woesearchaeota archaeon]